MWYQFHSHSVAGAAASGLADNRAALHPGEAGGEVLGGGESTTVNERDNGLGIVRLAFGRLEIFSFAFVIVNFHSPRGEGGTVLRSVPFAFAYAVVGEVAQYVIAVAGVAAAIVAQVDNECLGLEYFGKYVVKLLCPDLNARSGFWG